MKAIENWSVSSWKDRHNKGYFPNSEQHKEWKVYNELTKEFLDIAQPIFEDTALEIGCGYGEWMIPLSRLVKSVHGFDIHPEPLKKAIELFDQHKIYNCSVGLGNGVTITGPRYSLVYSISVFQHLPRIIVQQYLNQTLLLLAPGGRCVHHFRNKTEYEGLPANDIELNHTGDFSCGWTKEEVEIAANKAGFNNIKLYETNLFIYLYGQSST